MWQTPDTAPKTGEAFLADMGWPCACITCWNPVEEEWVYVVQQASVIDELTDYYFESEYGEASELKRWMPLPDMGA